MIISAQLPPNAAATAVGLLAERQLHPLEANLAANGVKAAPVPAMLPYPGTSPACTTRGVFVIGYSMTCFPWM
jgi:hypothetical protein